MAFVFPDVEQIAQDICQQVCESYKFLPEDLDALLLHGPVCLVERVGGFHDGVTDRAIVVVSVWGRTRPDAWHASSAIGEVMDSFTFGGRVGAAWVDQITRDVGEQQIMVSDLDERRVVSSFRIDVRKQKQHVADP